MQNKKMCWHCKKEIKEEASTWWLETNQKIVYVHDKCWRVLHKKTFGKYSNI